ncbi:MAG: deoxyribodipyrimidine photo-lyase, partial [Woeseia sp.]
RAMSGNGPAIVWFRQDLRLADNPALAAAVATGAPILPVYILDDDNAADWRMGAASRWWLHRSLTSLNVSLDGALHVLRGKADEVLPELAASVDASGVFWNRCYEPWRIARDKHIKSVLAADDRPVRSSNGSLLFEPATVTKDDGTPYKVFTPFYRNGCLKGTAGPRALVDTPRHYRLHRVENGKGIDNLALLPPIRWYDTIADRWSPGEKGAHDRLAAFLGHGIANYKEGRNRPDQSFVSRLSPHLHFGELSPHQAWHAARALDGDARLEQNVDHFLSELGWREFSHYLLYYWPELPRHNLQKKFNRFPWRDDADQLAAWQQGRTGYPMVDAGMRELWRTGYMHNRVRMLTGSFLVKNLLMHWHHGEDWFWDALVDADLANNSASWQWVAGTGADAAPYFRVFNPVTQGKKFDPDG